MCNFVCDYEASLSFFRQRIRKTLLSYSLSNTIHFYENSVIVTWKSIENRSLYFYQHFMETLKQRYMYI